MSPFYAICPHDTWSDISDTAFSEMCRQLSEQFSAFFPKVRFDFAQTQRICFPAF